MADAVEPLSISTIFRLTHILAQLEVETPIVALHPCADVFKFTYNPQIFIPNPVPQKGEAAT